MVIIYLHCIGVNYIIMYNIYKMYNAIYLHCLNVKIGIIIFSFDSLLNSFPQCRSWNVTLDLKNQTQTHQYLALFGVRVGGIVYLHSICHAGSFWKKMPLMHWAVCRLPWKNICPYEPEFVSALSPFPLSLSLPANTMALPCLDHSASVGFSANPPELLI